MSRVTTRTPSSKAVAVIIGVVIALIAATGCVSAPPQKRAKLVVGDSIVNMSAAHIRNRMADTTVIAANGHTWAQMSAKIPRTQYKSAVVLLGYNDILNGHISQNNIEFMMSQLKQRSPCVIALIPGRMPTPKLRAVGVRHQKALQAAGKRQGVFVIDRLYKDWNPNTKPAVTIFDGVHPNELGKQKVANAIRDAERLCP